MLALLLAHAGVAPAKRLVLGPLLGSGSFGHVFDGSLGGTPVVAKCAHQSVPHAHDYFRVEQFANERMTTSESPHCAPYLGTFGADDGSDYLVWRRSGSHTLDAYIADDDARGLERLSRDLLGYAACGPSNGQCAGPSNALMRQLLDQLLQCCALLRAHSLVHRDLKPENFLVVPDSDPDGAGSLQLIDFGSAVDVGAPRSAGPARGYHAGNRCPCSTLYCPPEQLLADHAPYGYDVYSAALVWLRCMVPRFRTSEEALFEFRIAVRDQSHSLQRWLHEAVGDGPPTFSAELALFDDEQVVVVIVYTWHATVRVCECEWGWGVRRAGPPRV